MYEVNAKHNMGHNNWEVPLKKGMAIHSSILAWRIPWIEETGGLHIVHGVAKSQTQLNQLTLCSTVG